MVKPQAAENTRCLVCKINLDPLIGKVVRANRHIKPFRVRGKILKRKTKIRRLPGDRVYQLDKGVRVLSVLANRNAGNHGQHRTAGLIYEFKVPPLEIILLSMRSLK